MLDIQAELHAAGQGWQDLYEAVADFKRRHDLHPCAVRPRDGLALRRDSERDLVQELVKRFRDIPPEQRRRLPALLNSLAQLEVVVGDLEASQHDFQEVARLVADPISQAEAHHNVYRAALERRDWTEALAALRRAAALDADAFEPFPLSRFELLRILGAGGFGATFLCEERGRAGRVVVKALRPDSLDHDADTLFREMRILQELDHPALLGVRDCGYADGDGARPYLVLEYFEGQTLAEHVNQHGPLSPEEWLEVCWPLARALQAVHGRGILHRSLRPGAVLLRREPLTPNPSPPGGEERTVASPLPSGERGRGEGVRWRVKLLDTGLSLKRALIHASASNPAARVQTALGRCVARTVPYAPSEVVGRPKGQVWVGPHSDIYSFGKLCAFALTGRPDPDGGDLVLLPEPWRQLLDDCTAWVFRRRPDNFGAVLDRIAHLPGAGDVVGRIERELHEAAIAEHTAALEADPNRIDAWVNRAGAFFRQGDFGRAVADYTRALELQPENAALYCRRALAHWRNRDLDAAIADYTEALRREPRNLEALGNRALVYAQKNAHDAAIADYNEALRINPRDEVLLYNRGNAYYCKGDYAHAIADYTEAVRLDPHHAWAYGNRAKAHALRGEHARAVADCTRVLQLDPHNVGALCDRAAACNFLGQPDRALADYTEALRLEPSAALYIERGMVHVALRDFEQAVADFSEALALDPDNAVAHVQRGNAHCDRDELDEALADFTEAARLDPKCATAYYNRGNVHARRGEHEQALADYGRALEIDPTMAEAYFNRANSHAARGAWDEAVADCTQAIRLAPDDAAAYVNRGNAHVSLGDLDRALADFTRAVELDPDDALNLCNRASLCARRGEYERALADYTEALRLDPADARVWNARGNVHADRGDREQAVRDYTRAIEVDPGCARAYHNRGNVHANRGELAQAIADFTEAIRLDPGYVSAWYNRGNAHAERGDHAAAVADYTEAIRLQPGHAGSLNNRGNSYHRLGEDERALADFAAATAADARFAMPLYNRANVHVHRGDWEAALADYTAAIALDPSDLAGYHSRGRVYAQLGRYAEAIADNLEALRLHPGHARTCNNLAWLWAACPQADLRDGARAVEHARIACEATGWRDPGCLDTLAAAYAESGNFAEAIRWQHQAVELASEGEKADYAARLRLYEAGQPYREPGPATA
jgi:tetratricopeptide (TPR) repeat protein